MERLARAGNSELSAITCRNQLPQGYCLIGPFCRILLGMSQVSHQEAGQGIKARFAIVATSDVRTLATDLSGAKIKELAAAAGHEVVYHSIVRNDLDDLLALLLHLQSRTDLDVIITTGGTGISRRDQTIAVVDKCITRPLPGFGELFRLLSYQEIGTAALMSRAAGGVAHDKLLFALPGSPAAVELAMGKLILPELGHLLGELRK
jgi:molybdenum cofactor biosynthesis protein B